MLQARHNLSIGLGRVIPVLVEGVLRRLAVLAAVGATALVAAAAAASPAPSVDGRAVLVGNGVSGELLHGVRQAQKVPMASITKIMTALVVLENARPNEIVSVGGPAPTIGGSSVGLRAGERLSVRDLLTALLVQSANDSAYALAYYVGEGSVTRFVRMMNRKAAELKLRDTHFVRPDGLDAAGHYSSARDLFKLARVAMHKPLFRRLVRIQTTTIPGGRSLRNWNDLLFTYPGMIGVKTGHTSAAGWSEVAAARRDGVTIYAVLLGSSSREGRNADLARLLDWGFDQYRSVTAIRGGAVYAEALVPFTDGRLRLVAAEPAYALVRVDRDLVERVVAPAMVDLPVEQGQKLGEVQVLDQGKVIATQPLLAAESIEEPGFGRRLGWYAGRAVDHAGDLFSGFVGLFT
jgi:serine-type D-Ala-D-Ala carboxypeptidase (penicillin-binding protein 5/6)